MNHRALLLLALFIASPAQPAGEHLEPERSVYSGHADFGFDKLLLEVFRAVLGANASVITIPSEFVYEHALGIVHHDRGYLLLGRYAERSMWGLYYPLLQSGSPIDQQLLVAAIPLRECGVELDADLGRELVALWEEVLRGTRYPDEPHGVRDGVGYHFASLPGRTPPGLVGQVQSPPPNSRMGKLVAVVEALHVYCQRQSSENMQGIESALTEYRRQR